MNMRKILWSALGILSLLSLGACERPPIDSKQTGYRGTGMAELMNPRLYADILAKNQAPEAIPAAAATPGVKASTAYQNVQVLGDLEVGEFTRHMIAITQWVAPKQGCTYCHEGANFASDKLYTKVVARRMLQMTQHLNSNWKQHVGDTGVTCYTCHRGNPVPENIWFHDKGPQTAKGPMGDRAGQNSPAIAPVYASLPYDPFTPFIQQGQNIRVATDAALPNGSKSTIKQAEWTYSLMMHMSDSLGVNCTYCHNTRSFGDWSQSSPQRVTAWHGIRMVRDVNTAYMDPLQKTFPAERLGPTGDAPKANCATCHQGVNKPLMGANMLKGHPELAAVVKVVPAPAPAAAPALPAPASDGLPATSGDAKGAVLYFKVGSKDLAGDALSGMKQLVETLKANPGAKAIISGFHSASGDKVSNHELAKGRAFAVRDALKQAGIAEDRIQLEKPIEESANASGEDAKARRVEIAVK